MGGLVRFGLVLRYAMMEVSGEVAASVDEPDSLYARWTGRPGRSILS